MSDKPQHSGPPPTDPAALRKRAEKLIQGMDLTALSAQAPEETQQMLHELRVHQIELEMQNEELRTAQEVIEAERERYYDFYNLAPVGYCTLSEKGLILEANLTAATLLGITRSALMKQPISRFIFRDDQDIYYLHRKKLFETGEPQECDLRLVTPDGTSFWAHLAEILAQAEDGTPVCRITLGDITKRKKAEATLKDTVALQAVTLNTLVEGVVTADQDGTIQTCNPALERMFGYSKDELCGKNVKVIMPDACAKTHDGYMRVCNHQQSSSTIMGARQNLAGKHYDGHVFPVEVTAQKTRHLDKVLYVASISDISELKKQQEKIEKLAYFDSLTGLPNRRLLEDRIHGLNADGPQALPGNALLFIDIDDFKQINDALGHRTGDMLLIEAGKRINACVSTNTDTVARLGGDEFCVVLSGLEGAEQAAGQQAKRVAEQISQELREPFLIDGNRLTVSASIGISVGRSGETDLHIRMKRADMAMYEAKKSGKNQVRLFSAQMENELLWRLKIIKDLATAIEQQALTVHYQPIVDDSGSIVKLEALVRWQHPTEGWIKPEAFIPFAEASHLIVLLGNQVLSTVLKDMENWLKTVPALQWTVAVNVSQFQLADPRFQAQVEHILSSFGFASGRLVFEVTESALADDIEASIHKMRALTSLGIAFSLDDFGTGYSSLEYLKRLPITELKIDKSFVNDILTDLDDVVIVKSICSLAKEMGLHVVAEGVETAEQFQFLKDMQCDRYQGYYLSKPRPAADIEQLFKSGPLPALSP